MAAAHFVAQRELGFLGDGFGELEVLEEVQASLQVLGAQIVLQAISKKLWIDGTLEGYFAVVVVGESQDVAAEGEVEVGVGGVGVWLYGICGL